MGRKKAYLATRPLKGNEGIVREGKGDNEVKWYTVRRLAQKHNCSESAIVKRIESDKLSYKVFNGVRHYEDIKTPILTLSERGRRANAVRHAALAAARAAKAKALAEQQADKPQPNRANIGQSPNSVASRMPGYSQLCANVYNLEKKIEQSLLVTRVPEIEQELKEIKKELGQIKIDSHVMGQAIREAVSIVQGLVEDLAEVVTQPTHLRQLTFKKLQTERRNRRLNIKQD